MTPGQIINWTTLALTSAIVFWRGRRSERVGMAILIVTFILTPMVERRDNWYAPQLGIMAVDWLTLAGLAWVVFRYGRAWAVCAVAFQAIAVLTDFAFMIAPRTLYRAYYFGNFSIGYLLLGAILGGVIFERARPIRPRGLRRSAPASASKSAKD